MQPRASISSSARASPGCVDRGDQLALDQHVGLAGAAGRDHEAAADGERRAHAAAPGTGWARRNASSASASPVLPCSGGRPWPIAASAAAERLALARARGVARARHEHDGVAVAQVLVELLGDLLEPAGGDVVRVPRGRQLHDAEARALAHGQRIEPARLGVDERVRADRDAEAPRVTFHADCSRRARELHALGGLVVARELVLDAGRAHVAEPALGELGLELLAEDAAPGHEPVGVAARRAGRPSPRSRR